MKQIITLLLFVLAFSTQSYASKATVVPMVNTTTINVDMAKKDGVFKNVKAFVANTVKKAMEGKTIAIIAHLTWVGLVIAYILNNDNSSEIGSFYIRQNIGLLLMGVIAGAVYVIPVVGWIVGAVLSIATLVFWIISIINAFGDKQKPVPLVGKYFQEWFAGIA